MAVNLLKGGSVNLNRESKGLRKIRVGLGWDANKQEGGADFDLDASVFLLGKNERVLSDNHFIFYGNTKSPCGAVFHTGDNITGEGDGDDEVIEIDLDRIDSRVEKMVFTVTIYDAEARRQNFGQVENSFIRIVDSERGVELAKYELDEEYSQETAINFGELYRNKDGSWEFKALGIGFNDGLIGFCKFYGVNIG